MDRPIVGDVVARDAPSSRPTPVLRRYRPDQVSRPNFSSGQAAPQVDEVDLTALLPGSRGGTPGTPARASVIMLSDSQARLVS